MDLCNINQIKGLLRRHGFRFPSPWGRISSSTRTSPTTSLKRPARTKPAASWRLAPASARSRSGAGTACRSCGGRRIGHRSAAHLAGDHGGVRQRDHPARRHSEAESAGAGGGSVRRLDPHGLRQPALQHHHAGADCAAGIPTVFRHHSDDSTGSGQAYLPYHGCPTLGVLLALSLSRQCELFECRRTALPSAPRSPRRSSGSPPPNSRRWQSATKGSFSGWFVRRFSCGARRRKRSASRFQQSADQGKIRLIQSCFRPHRAEQLGLAGSQLADAIPGALG